MDPTANRIIDALGGTTSVARITETPLSTVHSWRKNGIPRSRLAHLKLAVQAASLGIDVEQLAVPEPPADGELSPPFPNSTRGTVQRNPELVQAS